MRGAGSALFAGILLMVAGVLDLFYGIAAVANSKFYAGETTYVFSHQHTWGWITIIVGAIAITASLSLFAGGTYGRVIGIVAATIVGIESLFNIGGPHPWWSLGVFAVCIVVIHGLAVLGEPERV
jgi:hypothetical protein